MHNAKVGYHRASPRAGRSAVDTPRARAPRACAVEGAYRSAPRGGAGGWGSAAYGAGGLGLGLADDAGVGGPRAGGRTAGYLGWSASARGGYGGASARRERTLGAYAVVGGRAVEWVGWAEWAEWEEWEWEEEAPATRARYAARAAA